MGLAFDVTAAISDAANGLCALLAWIDGDRDVSPPIDGAGLRALMVALEEAMRELMPGGRLSPPEHWQFTDADLARVIRLEELSTEWTSSGAPPPEVATLADLCVRALCLGMSWRELVAGEHQGEAAEHEDR